MVLTVTLNPAVDYHVGLEHLNQGESLSAHSSLFFAGGKGINVSRVLQNLQIETKTLAFLGGFTGEYIKSLVKDILINVPIKDTSRINIKLKTLEKETEIHGQDPYIDQDELNSFKKQLSDANPCYLVLSGSAPKSLPNDTYCQLMDKVGKGVNIVLDTRGNALKEAISHCSIFLVKPNKDELAEFFDCEISSNEEVLKYAKKFYQSYDIKYLIVSLASEGAYFLFEDKVYKAQALKGELISSVGSGDSMIAGFIAQFIKSKDSLEAFKYAMSCGAGTAFSHGLCSLEKAERLYRQVDVILL